MYKMASYRINHLDSSGTHQYLNLDNKQSNDLLKKIEVIKGTINSSLTNFADNYQSHSACKVFMA